MNERRVRPLGRPVYGRAAGLNGLRRPRPRRLPTVSLVQRRLVLLAIVGGVAAWGLWRLFAVTTITVTAGSRSADVQAETRKLLDDSWRYRNLLTFDNEGFVSKLQQADPRLRNVMVRRTWFHTLVITAALKQPSLGWASDNQKFVLDVDGTVIGGMETGMKLPVVQDGSNLPVQVGQRVASPRFVTFVSQLMPGLAGLGIGVTSLDIKDTTLDLTVSTNKGYRLIFDTGREVGAELNDLKAVEGVLAAQKKLPAEYIDLRIAGKAYYK